MSYSLQRGEEIYQKMNLHLQRLSEALGKQVITLCSSTSARGELLTLLFNGGSHFYVCGMHRSSLLGFTSRNLESRIEFLRLKAKMKGLRPGKLFGCERKAPHPVCWLSSHWGDQNKGKRLNRFALLKPSAERILKFHFRMLTTQ